jgi:hypothetical protein
VDNTHARLRIATRIHFALLRHLGEGIDVGSMLKDDAQAREVLWVCQASRDPELIRLARQYERAGTLGDEPGHAAQETAWARDTSGFGVSQPPEMPEPGKPRKGGTSSTNASSGWLNPVSWLRRTHQHTR